MKMIYEFVGGCLNGKRFDREEMELISNGKTVDMSYMRAQGILCQREELDNQPKVPSYLGPMWDGLRFIDAAGKEYYDFQLKEDQKQGLECFAVLRYETQEVYDMLSH